MRVRLYSLSLCLYAMVGLSQPSCFAADGSAPSLSAQSEPVHLDDKQEHKAIEHEAWQQATQAGKQDLLSGDLEGAKTWLKKAYEIAQRFGQSDSRVAVSQSNLGQLYKAQGNYLLAERASRRSLELIRQNEPKDNFGFAVELSNLAGILKDEGKYGEAKPLYEAAIAILAEMRGKESVEVATVYDNLALLFQKQGDYKAAVGVQLKAIAVYEHELGADNPDLAIALGNLAESYRELNQSDKAEPLYERSLAIMRKAYGDKHPSVATALDNLAGLYVKEGKFN